jgi:hypothetical protein
MSTPGPDPARLDELRELRRRFADAAFDSPCVDASVIYRPPLTRNEPGDLPLGRSDPFLRGFFQGGGDLTPTVRCTAAGPSRDPYSSGDRFWEEPVRDSMASDPHALQSGWWGWFHRGGERERRRLDDLASTASQLVLGGSGRGGNPLLDWLIHLAERPDPVDPALGRGVVVWSQEVRFVTPESASGGIRFHQGPPDPRLLLTHTRAPSWWAVSLDNVFRLSRDVVTQTLAATEQGGGPRQVGRPRDDKKGEILNRVRDLKQQGVKWRNIYTKINEEFGTDYTYSRGGVLQKLIAEG